MTISRVNGGGWGVGDIFTNSQLNALDVNTTYGLDNRAGGGSVLGQLQMAGAGQIVESVATGANADTTYLVTGGNNVIRITSAVTANRAYTLSATSAVTGCHLMIYCEPSFVTYEVAIKDQAAATMFTIGNLASSDGQWAEFVYADSSWRLLRSSGAGGAKHHSQTFLADGTFTVPANVFELILTGCGAGGSGGAGWTGASGNTGTDVWGMGGGGGGAALLCSVCVPVTPGSIYSITIGTCSVGAEGDATTFGSLASFLGGGIGQGGSSVGNNGYRAVVQGGPPESGYVNEAPALQSSSTLITPSTVRSSNGQGGYGGNSTMPSAQLAGSRQAYGGFAGGAGGSGGTDSGSYRGGGGGGGGAAGPFGAGGAGGSGGNGNNGGVGTNGGNGTAGAANTGAGGGGGGAGGYGSSAGSTSGLGGAGGSGRLSVFWVR